MGGIEIRLSGNPQAGGCGYSSVGQSEEIPKPRTEAQQRAETGGVREVGVLGNSLVWSGKL